MRHPKALVSVGVTLVVLGAIVAGAVAIAGGKDEEPTTTAPTTTSGPSEAPGRTAPPSADLSAFPPEFMQCLKDRGVEFDGLDPDQLLHGGAVPPEVLNTCISMLHGGDGPP